jgi:hypothetical protein
MRRCRTFVPYIILYRGEGRDASGERRDVDGLQNSTRKILFMDGWIGW